MKTIAWDVDDVLNDLTHCWLEQSWWPGHGAKPVYAALTENPPHQALGVTLIEYLASLDAFRLSVAYEQLRPVPEMLRWFQQHGTRARHVAISAVPYRAADRSAAWVMRHFGLWIRTFAFVPSPRAGEVLLAYDADKSEYLRWLGKVDVLVEDSVANAKAAREMGIEVIVVPRPWNAGTGTMVDTLEELMSQLNL